MKFIRSLLADVNGQVSSKRLALFGIFGNMSYITIDVTHFKGHYETMIWTDWFIALLVFGGYITSEMLKQYGIKNVNNETTPV